MVTRNPIATTRQNVFVAPNLISQTTARNQKICQQNALSVTVPTQKTTEAAWFTNLLKLSNSQEPKTIQLKIIPISHVKITILVTTIF
jgi:hypothetical protein